MIAMMINKTEVFRNLKAEVKPAELPEAQGKGEMQLPSSRPL